MSENKGNEYLDSIKKFWDSKAKDYKNSYKSSWGDCYCMQLEIDTVNEFISEKDNILDIGCGNGLGTLELAYRKKVTIKGIDYSEPMIELAQKFLSEKSVISKLKGEVSFDVGDILNLKNEKQFFTKVITKRVIINLGNFSNQVKAAKEVHKILVPGGYFLMAEATFGGLQKINALRKEFGLEELKQPWHNLYIDENRFIAEVSSFFEVVKVVNYSSTYYIGSRVIQPFVKRMLGQSPEYLSEINRLFMHFPSYGDYGIQKLFILKKID